MRAISISAPGRTQLHHVPRPAPGPGQVRIEVEGCGVCASNLGPWKGLPWITYPLAPGDGGHEAWGRIDAVGPDVDGLAVGQRVACLSYRAYAERDVADATATVPLPPELEGVRFPGEPLGCAMNIFERSGIAAGQTVAIVGIGFLGALLTRLATAAGATVIAISRREYAREVARGAGAREVVRFDGEAAATVREITGGQMCPVVVEAVGTQAALDLASDLAAVRGRLVVAGYHQDGARQVNMQSWNWRGLDVVNAHERDPRRYVQGMARAVEAVATGRLDPAPLCTHVFPLDQLDRALDATLQRPDGFLKATVHP